MTALPAESAGVDEAVDHIAAKIAAGSTAEGLRVSSNGTLAPPRELVGGPVDTSSAADWGPRLEIDPTFEKGLPGRVAPGSSTAAISGSITDGFNDLPAPLRSMLAAAAQAQRLSNGDALAEAVLAYALATLGTRETHAQLGVGLTWKRADGLHVLTLNSGWRKLSELL